MPFRSGSTSYARFRVHGGPASAGTDLIERLSEAALGPMPPGDPPEVRAGFTAGAHVLDGEFDPGRMLSGGDVVFGLRIDTHRVPADVRRAYRAEAERTRADDLAGGDARLLGRGARREAREEADERCRAELRTGRHARSKHIEIWWRTAEHLLLAPAMSDSVVSVLRELFRETFEATLEPLTAGAIARERLDRTGRSRDYEDLRPSPFTGPPARAEAEADSGRDIARPLVPWTAGGTSEPQDFLGNEFLVWLWSQVDAGEGAFDAGGGVEVSLDRSVDLACAWDVGGTVALRGHAVHRLPEAADGLRTGKWPRKLGLLLAAGEQHAPLTLQGDRFVVGGLAMPRPEEPPESDAEALELRLSALRDLDGALMRLYAAFVDERTAGGWDANRSALSAWIAGRGAPPRTVVAPSGGPVRPPAAVTSVAAAPATDTESLPSTETPSDEPASSAEAVSESLGAA